MGCVDCRQNPFFFLDSTMRQSMSEMQAIGAPVAIFLLSDLVDPPPSLLLLLRTVELAVFPNAWRLDAPTRSAIRAYIEPVVGTVLWVGAAGLLNETGHGQTHVASTTGIAQIMPCGAGGLDMPARTVTTRIANGSDPSDDPLLRAANGTVYGIGQPWYPDAAAFKLAPTFCFNESSYATARARGGTVTVAVLGRYRDSTLQEASFVRATLPLDTESVGGQPSRSSQTGGSCSTALAECWPVHADRAQCVACEGQQQQRLIAAGCTEHDIKQYCSLTREVVWSSSPGLPRNVARAIAMRAGVHVFAGPDVQVQLGATWLTVLNVNASSNANGNAEQSVQVALPHGVAQVVDERKRIVCSHCSRWSVVLQRGETRWFSFAV